MNKIADDMTKIEVPGSSVEFFTFKKNDLIYYFFDTSLSTPPDPMVNAMLGLQLLDNEDKRLIMINHSIPNALFARINLNYDYDVESFEDNIKIEFKYKSNTDLQTDFSNNKCGR